MSKKIASVSKRAASAGRAAEYGVDAAQRRADGARGREVGVAAAQQLFPEAVLARREPGHDEDAEALVLAEHARRSAWLRFVRDLEPARLVAVAIDRRAPVGGDAQLGEGALGAHRAARGIDAPDVRRDAAGERRADESLAGVGQAQLAQRLRELGRHVDGVGGRVRRSA